MMLCAATRKHSIQAFILFLRIGTLTKTNNNNKKKINSGSFIFGKASSTRRNEVLHTL